jgi:hypothetical protein
MLIQELKIGLERKAVIEKLNIEQVGLSKEAIKRIRKLGCELLVSLARLRQVLLGSSVAMSEVQLGNGIGLCPWMGL